MIVVPGRLSLRRARSVLSAEFDAIRRRVPDLDAGDLVSFTLPLTLGLLGVIAIRRVFYRIGPRAASGLVTRIGLDSFARIEDNTRRIALLTLVGGLVALAFGLPLQTSNESTTTVLDDLLAAQLACLIAALSIAFVAESIRCAADIVDDQSLLLAWPWALVIASAGWSLATIVGPFETTRMITLLLNGWLPPVVEGQPRDQVIADLLPAGARWWAAFGPLPVIAVIWAYEAWRHDGLGAYPPVSRRRRHDLAAD